MTRLRSRFHWECSVRRGACLFVAAKWRRPWRSLVASLLVSVARSSLGVKLLTPSKSTSEQEGEEEAKESREAGLMIIFMIVRCNEAAVRLPDFSLRKTCVYLLSLHNIIKLVEIEMEVDEHGGSLGNLVKSQPSRRAREFWNGKKIIGNHKFACRKTGK